MFAVLLFACAPESHPDTLTCTADVDPEVGTVVTVSWEGDGPSRVQYGPTDEMTLVTPEGSGPSHAVQLYGLPAGQTVYWRATTDGVGSCAGSIENGVVPSDYPEVTITIDEPGRSEEPWYFGAWFQFLGDTPRVAAIDRATGNYVWYYTGESDMVTVDAQFVAGTNDVYFNQFQAAFAEDVGNLRRVTLGGETVGEWHLPLAHHMFAQLPDGKVAFQSLDIRPWTDPESGETEDVIGDRVMELEPADGSTVEVFSVWDWLEPTRNRHWEQLSLYPDGVDWTHGNAIHYTPSTDGYLLSLGHADVLIDFGRSDGEVVQMYGEEGIPVAEGDLSFDFQHDAKWNDDGTLTMFTTNLAADCAGAIQYEVRDGELHELWSHDVRDGDQEPVALGQVTRLSNGNVLIGYGAEGVLREVTPAGEVVWEAVAEQGHGFANGQLVRDWYAP